MYTVVGVRAGEGKTRKGTVHIKELGHRGESD